MDEALNQITRPPATPHQAIYFDRFGRVVDHAAFPSGWSLQKCLGSAAMRMSIILEDEPEVTSIIILNTETGIRFKLSTTDFNPEKWAAMFTEER